MISRRIYVPFSSILLRSYTLTYNAISMISEISTNKYKVNVGPQSIPASHTEKKKQLRWRW